MSQKDRKHNKQALAPSALASEGGVSSSSGISRRGWKVIGGGILVLLIGFYVLSLTDPMGQNLASRLSPFLILGGYAIIGLGILTRDKLS